MTNEQLLLEIGRMMGSTVRDAIQESEERMKLYIHHPFNEVQMSNAIGKYVYVFASNDAPKQSPLIQAE